MIIIIIIIIIAVVVFNLGEDQCVKKKTKNVTCFSYMGQLDGRRFFYHVQFFVLWSF